MRIAVDAMGGDQAPQEIVLGVAEAIRAGSVRPDEVVLVGQEDAVRAVQAEDPLLAEVAVQPAREVVGMAESPTAALRGKPDSSIAVALRMVKEGEAAAFVSAGNTGAVVAHALTILGRLPGVKRPAIAVTIEGASGPVCLLDVGANVHCKPLHLFQYGVMAEVFLRDVLGVEKPRVALLNIGEEEGKGTDLVRDTRKLFDDSPVNFIGNIEGNDLHSGRCEVVVCEGFVGNVVLKVIEGLGSMIYRALKTEMPDLAGSDSGRALRAVTAKLDYAEYGGAPLLGVDGQVTIMHGRSNRRAMASALWRAHQSMTSGMTDHIRRAMEGGR